MVGSASPGKRTFSSITAALFADSGWYDVNETLVEPLAWGHDAGCDFLSKPCTEWAQSRYTCVSRGEEACSYDRRATAYCDLTNHGKSLPEEHRYFADPYQGGFSELLDYCPVYRSFGNGDCTDGGSSGSWMPQGGQERCDHCRCFESSTNAYWTDRPSCFRMRCLNASRLEVRAGGQWRVCPEHGGKVYLSPMNDDVTGSILCPPATEMCDTSTDLWPTLSSIEPLTGPAAGGLPLTLRGSHLDALRPPVALTFGTAEGAETQALNLTILNSTTALAVLPRLLGATSFASADITLIDVDGRAAYLFGAFRYDPGWEPYAATAALFAVVVLLACYVVPEFIRRGCEGSGWREKVVWKTIDPKAELRYYTKTSGTADGARHGEEACHGGTPDGGAPAPAQATPLETAGAPAASVLGVEGSATQGAGDADSADATPAHVPSRAALADHATRAGNHPTEMV
jgi:hypothetical protein